MVTSVYDAMPTYVIGEQRRDYAEFFAFIVRIVRIWEHLLLII